MHSILFTFKIANILVILENYMNLSKNLKMNKVNSRLKLISDFINNNILSKKHKKKISSFYWQERGQDYRL